MIDKLNTKNLQLQRFLFVVVLFCIGATIYYFNYLFPLHADDWAYSFREVLVDYGFPSSNEKIASFKDILESQYAHYFNWGGRSVVHFIAQFLLWIGTPFNDIINTLAYVILIFSMYCICNKGKSTNAFLLILISTFVWFLVPRFTSDVFWITGSANYLWGTLLIILFIYPYVSYFFDERTDDKLYKTVLFFFAGIIAGWTNESTASVAILLIFTFCIYYKKNLKLPKWAVTGLIGLFFGFALMILAPGNYVRAALVAKQNVREQGLSIFETLWSNLSDMMSIRYLPYMLPVSLLFLFFLFLFFKSRKNMEKDEYKKVLFAAVLFFVAGQLSFFIMIVSPVFPAWAMFGQIVFIVIAIGILYANIEIRHKLFHYANLIAIIALVSLYGIDYYRKYPSMKLISDVYQAREASLKEQVANGIQDIVFTDKVAVHSKFHYEDLSTNPDQWLNNKYAFYYGVRSVRVVKAD